MTDNTTLNPGGGGDTIRDLARQGGTTKTQVMQIDAGGASANAEVLITAGQQTSANSLPVTMASDLPLVQVQALLQAILVELQIHSQLLIQGLNMREDLESMRNDASAWAQQIPQ